GGTTLPNDEPFDSMFFEHYGVNPFVPADEDSLSTFAVDVDTGSYTVTRRYIDEGFLPPKDAVRVEEFVNYFEQGYPTFYDEDFRILIDGAPAPFAGSDYRLIRVGLKARDVDARDRKPANLVFVVDVSGSMAREDRLELVKKALAILLDQLRTADRIGIVVYGSTGQAILEPTSDRERIRAAIEELRPSGSTNAEEGLRLAYDMARRAYDAHRINRILLCSDGVANVGVTGPEAILQTIRQEADRGIQLTTIGFGMGNYNDVLMEKLADKGDGAYYYVDDLPEARRVFVENLTGTLQTIARDVKVQVAFDPRLVSLYRLIGFENRDVRDQDFRNDKIDAGEVGAGHEVTALYEVKLAGEAAERSGRGRLLTVRLRWALPESVTEGAPAVREIERKLDARDLASRFESAAPRLRMDAAVAEFAEILRGSYWAKGSRIADLLPIVRPLAAELAGDERASEFAGMVERAVHLEATLTPEQQRERQGGGREGWPPEPRSGPEPQ
ncbi:MAG: von Willebrand factor type A domain-containing protein, partial [Candidatus Eisenbacteria bacterium]|nr:von Willebrand factor type A domain-containing protein [Candidatus Eisenbacteria bacterium]